MTLVLRLATADLHYRPGLIVHTASSGPVAALQALYLTLEHGREPLACAEVRANIAYLTGVPPEQVIRDVFALAGEIDWRGDPEAILARPPVAAHGACGPARALVDSLLHDWASRRAGRPLADWLGGEFAGSWPTNQTLFWGRDDALVRSAQDYVARGFRSLKLRVGVGSFEDDYRRIARLREVVGTDIELALDANGRWSLETAVANLRRLGPLGISYVEQPLAAGDWDGLARLQATCGIPIMVDEGVAGPADIDAMLGLEIAPLAHLKLVKLGGIGPLVWLGRRLAQHGVYVMVGQMNEGALATAAAAHCAMVLRPRYAELYGADGLVDDPASGLSYRDGNVVVPRAPGLGPVLDRTRTKEVWEIAA